MSSNAHTSAATKSAVEPWNRPVTKKTIVHVSIVCFVAWVISVYDYTLFGTLLPVIADDFGWDAADTTTINTYVTIGVFVVSLGVGTILDRLGRKRALILLVLGGALASGLTGLAAGIGSMIIIRAFTGLSISEEVVNAVYLNEMYRKVKKKGLIFALVQGGYPIGALLAAAISAAFLPVLGWRGSFVLAGVLGLAVVLLAMTLPESPTFEAMKEIKRRREAGDAAGADELAAEHGINQDAHAKGGLREVFSAEHRKHTISLSLAWFASWMAIQVFSVLGTTVLVEAKAVSFDNALFILILANAVGFCGYVFHGWLGDRISRRFTVILGWTVGGILSFVMLIGPSEAWFIFPMYALTLFFLNGPFAALLYYGGESFPAHVRGMGNNVAHVMAPVGGIAGSGLLAILLSTGASMIVAASIAGSAALLLGGVFMCFTRKVNQNTVEENAEVSV